MSKSARKTNNKGPFFIYVFTFYKKKILSEIKNTLFTCLTTIFRKMSTFCEIWAHISMLPCSFFSGGRGTSILCAINHQKDPHYFKPALTQWPLGLCVATHRPPIFCHSKTPNFWFVTQRPPISDFVTQKPIILIIWPKLWIVTITEARILRDLWPVVNLWHLTFHYTLTERPHNLYSVTERSPIIFGCSCHRKTHMSEVLGSTYTSLWYMSAPRFFCPPPWLSVFMFH